MCSFMFSNFCLFLGITSQIKNIYMPKKKYNKRGFLLLLLLGGGGGRGAGAFGSYRFP